MHNKIAEARGILSALGMPKAQQTDLCCYTILAMAGIKPDNRWNEATNEWMGIHGILLFVKAHYHMSYAENSRETFRKQAIHPFRLAAIIEDNQKTTNSPNYKYRITAEALEVISQYKEVQFDESLKRFTAYHTRLIDMYASKKRMTMMDVRINGEDYNFSTGRHNELQKAIIEEFAPRFAPDSECLYVGDTIEKDLVRNTEKLASIGFNITLHDKMPDVVLYCEDRDWIYFIEAVTSVGAMNPKRIIEIEGMTNRVNSGKIYVTAFPDFKTYKRFADSLAWETEVWIAEMPEHMIHLDGDKFLGPR